MARIASALNDAMVEWLLRLYDASFFEITLFIALQIFGANFNTMLNAFAVILACTALVYVVALCLWFISRMNEEPRSWLLLFFSESLFLGLTRKALQVFVDDLQPQGEATLSALRTELQNGSHESQLINVIYHLVSAGTGTGCSKRPPRR